MLHAGAAAKSLDMQLILCGVFDVQVHEELMEELMSEKLCTPMGMILLAYLTQQRGAQTSPLFTPLNE